MRVLAQLRYSIANARSDIAGAAWRTLAQVIRSRSANASGV
jgi:hypothetical protein